MPPVPLPTLPGVYYGYIKGIYEGLPTGNTVCFKSDDPTVDATQDLAYAQIIADAMGTVWATTLGPLQSDSVAGWDTRVYPLGHPLVPAALGHTTGNGSVIGNLAPVSAAAVIRHGVLRRGRGSQSHSAWSPLVTSQVTTDGKSLADGYRLGLGMEWENWIAGIQAAFVALAPTVTLDYVQLSKKGTGATYPIITTSADSLLGTERSRSPRP